MFDPRRSFPRFVRALASGLVLSASLAIPTASAQTTKSARDAYVEAWFKETAEADLAGALALYQQCLDSAATSDRELAARALLRIAKIAQARGETEVAKVQLHRLAKEFEGTAAVKEARAEAAAPAETPTGESREVIEARRWLDEMLTNAEDRSPEKATTILRVLGIEEVTRAHASRGGRLGAILYYADPEVLSLDEWLSIVSRESADDDVVRNVLLKLEARHLREIPQDVVKRVSEAKDETVAQFVSLALSIGTEEAYSALEIVLRAAFDRATSQSEGLRSPATLCRFVELDSPSSSRLVAAWLDGIDRGRAPGTFFEGTGYYSAFSAFLNRTAGSIEFWSRVRSWTNRSRARLLELLSLQTTAELPAFVADTMLVDSEPGIRSRAIAQQLRYGSDQARRVAARQLAREAPPIEVGPIGSALRDLSTAPVEAIEETSGALREYLYDHSYRSKAGLAALRLGLERGDVEAIHALFDPRFAESRALVWNGDSNRVAQAAFLDSNVLRPALAKDPDPDLLKKAVIAALAIPDPRLHLATLRTVEGTLDERAGAGLADLFAAVGSPRLDLELVLRGNTYLHLSVGSVRRLLRSPDRETRVRAIQQCTETSLLREVVGDCDPSDFAPLFERAKQRRDFQLALEILRRVAPEDRLVVEVFLFTLPREADALVVACERGGGDLLGEVAGYAAETVAHGSRLDNTLRQRVSEVLTGLVVPEQLVHALRTVSRGGDRTGFLRGIADVLRANLGTWRTSLVNREAARVVAAQLASPTVDLGVGEEIAALGGDEFARGLLAHPDSLVRQIGLRALAVLGEKDAVIDYSRTHANPEEWVRPLLRVGAREEILDAIRTGRVTRTEVASRVYADTDPALLRDVLLGEAPVDALFSTRSDGHAILKRLIDARVVAKDVDALVRAVDFYNTRDAIAGLFQLGAVDRLLEMYTRLSTDPSRALFDEMRARTGWPEPNVSNTVEFLAEREALVAEWRERLAK